MVHCANIESINPRSSSEQTVWQTWLVANAWLKSLLKTFILHWFLLKPETDIYWNLSFKGNEYVQLEDQQLIYVKNHV